MNKSNFRIFSIVIFSFILFCCFVSVFAQKKAGAESYKLGKSAYDSKDYQKAITYFEKSISENVKDYGAKSPYMISLSYIKMGQCEKAKAFFKKAYNADPQNGGASDRSKFIKKLKECNLTIKDITSNGTESESSRKASNFTNRNKETTSNSTSIEVEKSNNNIENSHAEVNTVSPEGTNTRADMQSDSGGIFFFILIIVIISIIIYFVVRRYNKRNTQRNLQSRTREDYDSDGRVNSGEYSQRGGYTTRQHSQGSFIDNTPDIASTFINLASSISSHRSHRSGSSHHTSDQSTDSFTDRS